MSVPIIYGDENNPILLNGDENNPILLNGDENDPILLNGDENDPILLDDSDDDDQTEHFACPTREWWRYEKRQETVFSGPYDKNTNQYKDVVQMLLGDLKGFKWQHILCRDQLIKFSMSLAKRMQNKDTNYKVFLAHVKADDTECEIVLSVMVFSLENDTVAKVHLLCSGVPEMGGGLLKHAIKHFKQIETLGVVRLTPLDRVKTFYNKHGFEDVGSKNFELKLRRPESPEKKVRRIIPDK